MTMNLGITNISSAIEEVIENLYQILPELLAGKTKDLRPGQILMISSEDNVVFSPDRITDLFIHYKNEMKKDR